MILPGLMLALVAVWQSWGCPHPCPRLGAAGAGCQPGHFFSNPKDPVIVGSCGCGILWFCGSVILLQPRGASGLLQGALWHLLCLPPACCFLLGFQEPTDIYVRLEGEILKKASASVCQYWSEKQLFKSKVYASKKLKVKCSFPQSDLKGQWGEKQKPSLGTVQETRWNLRSVRGRRQGCLSNSLSLWWGTKMLSKTLNYYLGDRILSVNAN